MHAERELKRLGEVKSLVRRRIARRRARTAAQLERVARPLQWIDRVRGYWQQAGPLVQLAAGPVGLWLLRSLFRRRKFAGPLIRWGPSAWTALRYAFLRPTSSRA